MPDLRFVTVMLAALSMGLAFSHLLQLPPRMRLDGATWLTTQQVFGLYGSVGALVEIGALVVAGVSVWIFRGSPAFGWTLAGGICLAVALAVWLALVAPANARILQWTAGQLPDDWGRWRAQWEYAHATRALLMIAGVGFLVRSAMAGTQTAG